MISQLLNMHKIKFPIMDSLFEDKKLPKTMDIHIDLHSILAEIYKSYNYMDTALLDKENGIAISSCLINIAAHYRLYFYSRHRVYTRIYFYFCDNKPKNNSAYMAEYGIKFFDKYTAANDEYKPVNIEVSNNIKLVKIITSYLQDVHYIDCRDIEPMVAASYMISTSSVSHLVITKDTYWYQCLNAADNVYVLHLNRDSSDLITKDNVYTHLLSKNKYEPRYVTAEMLSVIYSFCGVKNRDIRGVNDYGLVKIIKILDMAIDRHIIKDKYTHIKNILDEVYTGNDADHIINIFKAIDMQFQVQALTTAQKEKLRKDIVNRYNKRDLVNLNNTHYKGDYSLMLEELAKGAVSTMQSSSGIKW